MTNNYTDAEAKLQQHVVKEINGKRVKEIIVLIKARSFLDELNLEHLTS